MAVMEKRKTNIHETKKILKMKTILKELKT